MRILFLVLISFSLFQCRNHRSGKASGEPQPAAKSQPEEAFLPLLMDGGYNWPGQTDPFELRSVRIAGDTLVVEVRYSGGCEAHDFSLHSNGTIMKSLPPQMNLWLEHEDHGDACRALITRNLKFDLSPLQTLDYPEIHLYVNADRARKAIFRR